MSENTPQDDVEVLGRVTVPSGKVLIVDTGQLRYWCHDRPPGVLQSGVDEFSECVENSVDMMIEGPDAEEAGLKFDRSVHPLYLYDVLTERVDALEALFLESNQTHSLEARMVPLKERVTHRQRIDQALEYGNGAGPISFSWIWACAVANVPNDRDLRVLGTRMPAGPNAGRWRAVSLECQPGVTIATSEKVGKVMVDEARLMFADVNALGQWKHDEPLDGLGDCLFWGRDAELIARLVLAPHVNENTWGWLDIPVAEALQRAREIDKLKAEREALFAIDFRPHSHHHVVMEQVRHEPTESGVVDVGNATMCTFATTWGDGFFPVYRDLDQDGKLVQIRLDLGNDEIVSRQEKFNELWFGEFAKMAFVSRRIVDDGEPVRWLYREQPNREEDSGWRLFCGNESQEYLDNYENIALMPLREILHIDRSLEEILRSPVGSAFERETGDEEFEPVDDF